MKKGDVPNIAARFFKWFSHKTHREGLEGDLYELFEFRRQEHGLTRARIMYCLDILTLLRPSVAKSTSKNNPRSIIFMSITGNYFKTTLRAGKKKLWFSSINLIGLTLGITSLLFILLYIGDELKYDAHITEADQKFRVYNIRQDEDGGERYLPIVPPVFAPSFKENFPQVEKAGRIMYDYGGTVFTINGNTFSEKNGVFAEIDALEILDLKMISGSLDEMDQPLSVVLSESTFKKFFEGEPFDNQTIKFGRLDLQVVGVYEDLPEQSHILLDYVFSFEYAIYNVAEERINSWIWQQFYTYIQLKPGTDKEFIQQQIQDYVAIQAKAQTGEYGFSYTPQLQYIQDIHLHSSNFEWDIAVIGNYQAIIFLSIAAMIILFIACLNFVNLTMAQALKRAKEVCVRKFIGARRSQLITQYSFEAILYTIFAGILSVIIVLALLPEFNSFAEKTILNSTLFEPVYISLYVLFLLVLGFISGIYPTIVITSFDPIKTVKGGGNFEVGRNTSSKINIRQLLVGAQYMLSIGLILTSLIIQKQYGFLQNMDMGFEKENLLVIQRSGGMNVDHEQLKQRFSNDPSITDIALTYGTPGGIIAGDGVFLPNKSDQEQSTNMFMIDDDYIRTMGIDIIAGRDFNDEMTTDITGAFIVNETAVRNFGLGTPEEAIGETVHWKTWANNDSLKRGEIIGVVKDFNYKSLHNEMSSAVLHIEPHSYQSLLIRTAKGKTKEALNFLETTFKDFEPVRPFEYEFIDQTFAKFYKAEQKLNWLFNLFTLMAVFTAGIGLFGLVSFNIANRGKEISIRKVLGASVGSVVKLLVTRYFVMGLVSLLIASPLVYYFSSIWLENFSYTIDINGWLFVQVAIISLLFTAVAVGVQAYKGAVANPAQKLRTE